MATFPNQQVALGRKKGCNCFSLPFCEQLKNGNKHVFRELILGKTVPALAQRPLGFFSTRLHRIIYAFLLESHYHKILLVLSCSIVLLTRQKQINCHYPVKNSVPVSGRDAGGAGGARPRQLPCAD